MTGESIYDLLVIGGGINGVGIARDAAGRGLSVCLCEQDDLAGHTSSASTKLIHGGLRYLEQYDFRLVRHALQERQHLLHIAPHIVHPQRFVLPHHVSLRPRWLIRLGLFLYDRLAATGPLPGSKGVNLNRHPAGAALKPVYTKGFEFSDCRVQDARLVVLNAMAAAHRGAVIRTRTRCTGLRRHSTHWDGILEGRDSGAREQVRARAVVNAAGPWVEQVERLGGMASSGRRMRYVKGSHIVVPRLFPPDYAYVFQNPDRRVLFAIPFEREYTLLGTTEIELERLPETVQITSQETDYICQSVSRYLRRPVYPEDVVWSFSGVRPLYGDGAENASKVSRDYHLQLDRERAPLLSIHGGKLTTYRRLAEESMELLAEVMPEMGKAWTASVTLPGGDLPGGDFEAFLSDCLARYPQFPETLVTRYAEHYGSRIDRLLGGCPGIEALGYHFGNRLFEREVCYLVENEFAETAEDIVWRRTRCGLGMSIPEIACLQQWLVARNER